MDRKITCIGCPLGCDITVQHGRRQYHRHIGYTCRKARSYASNEAADPARTLTTTMRDEHGGLIPSNQTGR
jgi:CxxC motif-containing protein